jgi:hypothetical protein
MANTGIGKATERDVNAKCQRFSVPWTNREKQAKEFSLYFSDDVCTSAACEPHAEPNGIRNAPTWQQQCHDECRCRNAVPVGLVLGLGQGQRVVAPTGLHRLVQPTM